MSPAQPGQSSTALVYRGYLPSGTIDSSHPLGNGVAFSVFENSLPVSVNQTTQTITIPAYTFTENYVRILLQMFWAGGLTATAGPNFSPTNITQVFNYQNQSGGFLTTGGTGTLLEVLTYWGMVNDYTQDITLTFDSTGLFPTNSTLDLQVFGFQ